jgi:poly [ADP-ribose] polymerase 10/14/15
VVLAGRQGQDALNASKTLDGQWVVYAESAGAQFEYYYQLLRDGDIDDSDSGAGSAINKSGVINVDVAGRVTSNTAGKGKAYDAMGTGTLYSVDIVRMIQKNAKSGHERSVRRVEEAMKEGDDGDVQIDILDDDTDAITQVHASKSAVRSKVAAAGGTVLLDDETQHMLELDDDGGSDEGDDKDSGFDDPMPPFPRDLMGESIMLVKRGQIIQVQKKRNDGWHYGFVLLQPKPSAHIPTQQTHQTMLANSKVTVDDESTHPLQGGDDDDDAAASSSGWFHESFTRPPTAAQMKDLQDSLGGQQQAVDALAPPPTWTGEIDPLEVQMVPIREKSAEHTRVITKFTESLKPFVDAKQLSIAGLKRVQNLALWQSYAAYRKTMLMRAEKEAIGAARLAKYELSTVFHGSSAFAIPKIGQQGFQRNFAGKNATVYGRGNYFALSSSYSVHKVYTPKDSSGVKRMFIARAMVGESCVGKNDMKVPSERKPNILFDSTTDSMKSPQLYVTYHDAQAYPDYLVEFKMDGANV